MSIEEIREYCLSLPYAEETLPFDDDTLVYKVGGRMFALPTLSHHDQVAVKCDPDIAIKAETGEPVRLCLNCNKGCVDAIQNRRYITCVLNAENGEEATMSIKPGDGQKKVVIVGGGVAGLEAARVAAIRGYEVDLYEKEDRVGGQIHLAAVPPRKDEILRSVAYFECILPALGVNIHLNTEAIATVLLIEIVPEEAGGGLPHEGHLTAVGLDVIHDELIVQHIPGGELRQSLRVGGAAVKEVIHQVIEA